MSRGLIFKKSGNSFMTGWTCYRGKSKCFSQGILRKNNNRDAVLMISFMCLSVRCRELATRETRSEMKRERAK